MTELKLPHPLPVPTEKHVRDCGFSGDITRYPLSAKAYLRRCSMNGIDPEQPPSPAWYYAPNKWCQDNT